MNATRKWIIFSFFSVIIAFLVIQLFSLQVLGEKYKEEAARNAYDAIPIIPDRGLIYDRNGELLISNSRIYDLQVIYKKVKFKEDSAKKMSELQQLLGIPRKDFLKKWEEARLKYRQPVTIAKELSQIDFAKIQDRLIEYKGFYISPRTVRSYTYPHLAHVLGYVSEIRGSQLEEFENDSVEYYKQGDYIGQVGLEAFYEEHLRGKKGVKYIVTDVKGRKKGKYQDGELDISAVAGKDLYTSIDIELQKYGELLLENKKGSVVAIDPKTGEIIAMVSAPSYDPNLLTGREFRSNYGNLLLNENKPLFNRAVRSFYPPGSTFKTVQALVGMQEGVIDNHTAFPCNMALVKCHGHPPADLQRSIQYSCNPYYFQVFRRIIYQNKIVQHDSIRSTTDDGNGYQGFERWRDYMSNFGLGRKLGIDLAEERDGNVPEIALYDKRYGKGKWKFSNLYSLGIGQGEMGIVPVQLANVAAIIANKGYFYTPHFVRKVGKNGKKLKQYRKKHHTGIDAKHFDVIIRGMRDAVKAGTVWSGAVPYNVEICGKTGTVQNPHGEDHSVFIAFAPKDNPQIAIAVHVENAGFGGVMAAPIATLMIQYYLKREISDRMKYAEKTVIDKKLIFTKEEENEN